MKRQALASARTGSRNLVPRAADCFPLPFHSLQGTLRACRAKTMLLAPIQMIISLLGSGARRERKIVGLVQLEQPTFPPCTTAQHIQLCGQLCSVL